MSWKALFRPAGRRDARVYWRRRLLAVGILFVVVLVGVWAVTRHGSSPAPGAPVYAVASPIQPSASPSAPGSAAAVVPLATPDGAGTTAVPGAQPSSSPLASDGGQPTTSPGPDPTATAGTAPATCQDRDITVRVSPSTLRVNQGGDVSFALVVSARGVDCDVAGLARTVQVANGAGPVWSSSRCGYPPTGPTLVHPGAPVTFQVTWNTRSCGPGNSGPVAPGAYDVIGRAGGVSGFGGSLTVGRSE